jgi:pimeloyl-ACP methyl ester carboxylesterase
MAGLNVWIVDPAALASLRPPVLRIQGSASPSPVHHLVAHLAGVIPGATIATIAGADHLMPLTAPTEIGRLIGDFCGTPSIR